MPAGSILSEQFSGVHDVAEFSVQTGQGSSVNHIGVEAFAIVSRAREGCAGVTDQRHLKAEVAGHASRCRNAVIGGQPEKHQFLMALISQPIFQVGSDETTVHVLDKLHLVFEGFSPREEGEAGFLCPERALWLQRGVSDMHDGPSSFPPVGEHGLRMGFKRWIVALAPNGVVETGLAVDEEKRFAAAHTSGRAWLSMTSLMRVETPERCIKTLAEISLEYFSILSLF